jgi:ABC-type Fe3+ transport system substrate-binding protein
VIGGPGSIGAKAGCGLCTGLLLAIGGCDNSPSPEAAAIGIVNTGDFAGPSLEPEALAVTAAGGTFATVTAAGVVRHATNPDGAAALLEWLSGESAQVIIMAESAALPAHPDVAPDPPMAAVGSLPPGPLPVAQAAAWLGPAVLLAERAGYR